eukprot:TRINITY_DN43364_c0_g1_i1.p1 TRINITY_DN43364_c0_g1~~TRINITY_DN43364_c0_g1_i1.p1  ORF type:complete len:403 (+),score=75.87 TRINITY_DN43364_c0_g1_i1:83-1210(+)
MVAAAGPYAICGEAVLRACVNAGTHYIDVTGETVWVKEMIDRYHDVAKSKGIMVVHCAAQVCAIDDINCYLLAQKLGPLKQFREYFFQSGGVTGGTFGTSVATLEAMTPEKFKIYSDPFSLGGRRKSGIRDEERDCDAAAQDQVYPSIWCQPAYSGHTGARIIRRSCELFESESSETRSLNYGADLSVVIRDGAASKRAAEQMVLTSGPPKSAESARAAARQMREQQSQGAVPQPGEGPPAETRALYSSEVFALAEDESGRWAYVHYNGPEAYEVTAMVAVTGAVVLAEELDRIKPGLRGGVVTPAFAFSGTSFVQRLQDSSFARQASSSRMRFDIKDGKPPEEILKEAMAKRTRRSVECQAELVRGNLKAWAQA